VRTFAINAASLLDSSGSERLHGIRSRVPLDVLVPEIAREER